MKILALESADQACSVALWLDGEVRERFEIAPRRQTLLLLPWVKEMLAVAGLSLSQLDGLAFGHGPGAFTGVRVATSVAQGLAFSANLPVVGVSTLAALAQGINERLPAADALLPVLDARMQEIYLGAYARDADGLVTALADDCVCPPESLPKLPKRDWQGGGGGLIYADTLATQLTLTGQTEALYPQAACVAALAARAFERGDAQEAVAVRPVYLRDKVIRGAIR